MVDIGKKAPAFHLVDQEGKTHRLSNYLGQHVVLYFYPKDGTSGCTKQACDFRDSNSILKKTGVVVLGVSPQGIESKTKFASKYDLNFPVLADIESKVCEKYGVWQEKSMYGRTYMGVVRTTYLINKSGKIIKRWDKVKVEGHVKQIILALKESH